ILGFAATVLLWGVVAAGIGLTRSRGGIAAALVTTALLTALAIGRDRLSRGRHGVAAVVGGTLLAGTFLAAAITREGPLLRFLASDPREIGSDARVQIWKLSLQAWRRFPALGSGLGTFREAFRHVQPADFSGLVEQAHSDPLQLLVTGGAIGALLGVIAFAS